MGLRILLVALGFVILSCDKAKDLINPKVEKTEHKLSELTVSIPPFELEVDWQKAQDPFSILIWGNAMRGLAAYDLDSRDYPVVESLGRWERDPEGLKYTFTVLPTAKWSDGIKVSADDFLNALQRILSPEKKSPWIQELLVIKNAKEFSEGKVKFDQVGAQVSDGKLVLHLNRVCNYFPAIFAHPSLSPIRRDMIPLLEKRGNVTKLPTTGPFRIKSFNPGKDLELVQNSEFAGPKSKISRIRIKLDPTEKGGREFNEQKVDILFDPSSTDPFPTTEITLLVMNTGIKPTSNPIFRRGLALSINRSEISRHLDPSPAPLGSMIPPGHLGHEGSRGVRYDPTFALEFMNRSGYSNLAEREPVTIRYPPDPGLKKVAEEIAQQLKQNISLNVKLEEYGGPVILGKKDPTVIYLQVWKSSVLDPEPYLTLFKKGGLFYSSGWKEWDFNKYIESARSQKDRDQRVKLYAKAQHALIDEEVVIFPLFVSNQGYLAKRKVTHLTFNPLGFLNLGGLEVQ